MDPNETLKRCRAAIADYHKANGSLDPDGCQDALFELFDAFQDLDDWIMRGGFLPKEWDRAA